MDTLEALRLFVSIDETGRLSAAARQEAVATSTVSVALQQREERVGAKLIVRSTRRLALTYLPMLRRRDDQRRRHPAREGNAQHADLEQLMTTSEECSIILEIIPAVSRRRRDDIVFW
jgi:hypothetical protein